MLTGGLCYHAGEWFDKENTVALLRAEVERARGKVNKQEGNERAGAAARVQTLSAKLAEVEAGRCLKPFRLSDLAHPEVPGVRLAPGATELPGEAELDWEE